MMRAINHSPQGEMLEEGVVTAIRGDQAYVKTVQQEACSSCSAKGACQAMGGGKERIVPALNQVGAKRGDRVRLGISRTSVLSAGFLAYMVPVFALMAGAALGKYLGPSWGFDSQTAAVVGGLTLLVIGWTGVRWLSDRLAKKGRFMVRVVAVVQKGETDAVEQDSCRL